MNVEVRMLLRFGFLVALSLAACSEETVSQVRPAIHVTPEAIDLGDTPVGQLKKHQVDIVSLGSAPLTVKLITLGPAVGSTTVSQDLALNVAEMLPKIVATSQTMTFEVQHIPRDAILDSGALHIQSDDPTLGEVIVPITQAATGAPRVAAVPDVEAADVEAGTPGGVRTFLDSIHFGQVNVGLRKQETVFVVNIGNGNSPLDIRSVQIVEANIPDLTVAPSPDPATDEILMPPLSAKGVRAGTVRSMRIDVSWRPSSVGQMLAATLRVSSNDPRTPALDIPLSGTTEMVDPPLMRVEPRSLDFGSVTTGMEATRSLTVFNDGGSVLPVEPLTITGTPTFSLVDAPVVSMINPGQSKSFNVKYRPPAAGAHVGAVQVESLGISTVDVALHGQGTTTMMCVPSAPDPGEPGNESCATAVNRGSLQLQVNQQESVTASDALFDQAGDQDWSRWNLEVVAGCDFVGYALTARVTLAPGEQGEVCLNVGDCVTPERTRCSAAGSDATVYLFPADDLCNQFGNQVPINIQVRSTGGTLSCQPYTLSFRAR